MNRRQETQLIWKKSFAQTITPTLGNELMSDPSLEGTYTAGLCAGLTKDQTPTISQSADARSGSKAQSFTAIAANDGVRYVTVNPTPNAFYRMSVWGKRTAGTTSTTKPQTWQNGAVGKTTPGWSTSIYSQRILTPLSMNTNQISLYLAGDGSSSNWPTVIVDDASIKTIVLSSCFKSFRNSTSTASVKAKLTVDSTSATFTGVAGNIDSATNPRNFVLTAIVPEQLASRLFLYQCSDGVFTAKGYPVIDYVIGAQLELKHIDTTTYEVWYNNILQIRETINDPNINFNTLYAQFSTYEGNFFNSFQAIPL